jgi:hypothetical protein
MLGRRRGNLVALATVSALLATVGCSRTLTSAAETAPQLGVDYQVSWTDDPANQQFVVQLTALGDRKICTGPSLWPSQTGHMGGSGLVVSLRVENDTYIYKDTEMEACIYRACQNPIAHGSVLRSVLTYDGFGLTSDRWSAEKNLNFDPKPYWCKFK